MLYKEITLPFEKATSRIHKWVFNTLFVLILCFIFLGCTNIFGAQGIFILIALFFSIVYILLKAKVVINWPAIFSIAFMICYTVSAIIYSKDMIATSVFYSSMLVVLVQLFHCYEDKNKFLKYMLITYLGGLFVSFSLMILSTYWQQGASLSGDVVSSFWNSNTVSRTGLSLYEIGLFGVAFSILFFKNKFRKWFFVPIILALILFCFYVSMKIGNRSFLVATAVIIYAALAFKVLNSDKKNKSWTITLVAFNVFLLGFIALILLNKYGVIKIPDSWMEIKIIKRIFSEDISQGRPQLWREFFMKFYKYPIGGLTNNMTNKFAHNIFLDFYTFGGFPSFIISTTFFVHFFIYLFRYTTNAKYSYFLRGTIFLISFAIIGLGFVEPIYQANPNCITPLFIIFLYIRHYRFLEKRENAKQFEKKEEKINA